MDPEDISCPGADSDVDTHMPVIVGGSEMTVQVVSVHDMRNVTVEDVNCGEYSSDVQSVKAVDENVVIPDGDDMATNVTVEAVMNTIADLPDGIKTENEECVNMAENGDAMGHGSPVPIECAVEDVDNMKVQVAIKILNSGQDITGITAWMLSFCCILT